MIRATLLLIALTFAVGPACKGKEGGGFHARMDNKKTAEEQRFLKVEREKRLELSTSTLARWCSTN